jgi:glycosyltransferase involved in cell wall biosynthesis
VKTVHIDTERTWRGGEQQAIFLAAGLHRRGVGVLAVGQPESPFVARARKEGLRTAEIEMRGEADPAAIVRLVRLLRREGPDIVHMHTSHAHTLGVLASRIAGRGKTIVSRRVDFSIHRNRLKANILKYRFGVDRYVAISEGVRSAMVADGVPRARIDIVPSGVDLDELGKTPCRDYREEFNIPPSAPVVGDVAHFGWHKAQEFLVRACPSIWRAMPEARVVLVGDGDCRPKVEREAERIGADERLIFTGHRKDARALVRWFDVFVMCSVKEGLCTSILDAHALGTPVVASRVGGIPEAVEDRVSGLLVPPRDPEALASAILEILGDPGLGRRLNAAGRARVEARFSTETLVEGTLRVYERVLAGETP